MGNFNAQQFGVDMADSALKWICPLVYGVGRGIHQGVTTGDWWGASDKWADAICPVGIGSTYAATENFIRGNPAEGVRHTQKALFPGIDPISESLTEGVGQLGKWGIQEMGAANAKNNQIKNDPALQEKKETPKDKVDEQEQIIAEKDEARDITNQQANTARKAAYQAAINSGATPAQAQAAADAQTPIGNFAGNYAALAGAGANARADYRERQGYADALGRETLNLAEARNKAILAAFFQGGGDGSKFGSGIFPGGGNNNNSSNNNTGSGESVGGGN